MCAFTGFMRCYEYMEAPEGRPNHNLLNHSSICTDDKLGISFWSDKCSYSDPTVKHRMVDWGFLPLGSKVMVEEYIQVKLKHTTYFFVKEDGQPLSRDYFVNLLDVCILHVDWRFLNCMPHAFCSGGASFTWLDGESIVAVKYFARWGPKLKVVYHYTKTIFVTMKPQKIFQVAEQYRWPWRSAQLNYIAHNVVQMYAKPGKRHPHQLMMQKFFPAYFQKNKQHIPAIYPSMQVAYRIALQKKDWVLSMYIRHNQAKKKQFQKYQAKWVYIAAWYAGP